MYLASLGVIARKHGITFHAYADDCQLYVAISKENVPLVKQRIKNLLAEIKRWMSSNMLNLNDDKTEVLTVQGPRGNLANLQSPTIGSEEITSKKCVRILDVDLDQPIT